MSADTLRRAASLMRERAEAARAGRWRTEPSALTPEATLVVAEREGYLRRVATCSGSLPEGNLVNAEHIASWHPAVALAVAGFLDAIAHRTYLPSDVRRPHVEDVEWAEQIARAYLGESPC